MSKGCLLRSLADGVKMVSREVEDNSCLRQTRLTAPFEIAREHRLTRLVLPAAVGRRLAVVPVTDGRLWLESLNSRNVANAWLGKPPTKLSSRATQRDLMRRDLEISVRDEAALSLFALLPLWSSGPSPANRDLIGNTGRLHHRQHLKKYCAVGMQRATGT